MHLINHLKLALIAVLGTALWTAPLSAAGTLPLAMAQQVDINGKPLAGCQVLFFVAGTVSSPQNSFSDFSLSQNPNSILNCDQFGRVPMFWLADGLIHVRLTDSTGIQVLDTTMQVLGPSSGGGGGGGTVDPTTVLSTGDAKIRYGTGPLSGFVRENGLTIGNGSSGATERANADTQALFIYLYGTDPNLVVSGGRTGNALNDYNANKTIAMPDMRGRMPIGLDDMGNSAAGRFGTAAFTAGSATVIGSTIGSTQITLARSDLPNVAPTFSGAVTPLSQGNILQFSGTFVSNIANTGGLAHGFNNADPSQITPSVIPQGIVQSLNGGVAQTTPTTISPTMLMTFYMKL
jgi:microcystin-dependent protein